MQNFYKFEFSWTKLAAKVINDELLSKEKLWFTDTTRQENSPALQHSNVIHLVVGDRSAVPEGTKIEDIMIPKLSSVAHHFPTTLTVLEAFEKELDGKLIKAQIVRLEPHQHVYPHIDGPRKTNFYNFCDRYHLVIISTAGSSLTYLDETVIMQENELWWFDNQKLHSAYNPSDDWRIHLIFDLEPNSGVCRRDMKSNDKG